MESALLSKSLDQRIELIAKLFGKLRAKLGIMVGFNILKLGQPTGDIHIKQLLHIFCGNTGGPLDRIFRRHEPDWSFHPFSRCHRNVRKSI